MAANDSGEAFVDELAKASPESFAAIAPVVFDRYAQMNPDAFGAYVGRIVYSDFQRNDIPLMMARFADVIGDNPKALEYFGQLNAYLGGFKALAEKAPAKTEPKKEEPKPKTDESATRAQEWAGESSNARNALAKTEFQRLITGKKLDSEDRGQIETLYLSKAQRLAEQYFPNWKKTAQGYIASGNKSAYLRFMASIDKRVVPEAVNYAVSRTLRTPGRPVAVAHTPGTRPAAAKPVNGFKFVGSEPPTSEVRFGAGFTTPQMIMRNQAILKDGTKVQWR
jgi:hypothetical protein